MTEIRIVENGVEKAITDIGPYLAEARGIEDLLAGFFRNAGDSLASLQPQLPELRKLDQRRVELQTIFDLWYSGAELEELADLRDRVAAAIRARSS